MTNKVIASLAIDPSNSKNIFGGAIGLTEHQTLGTFAGGVFKSSSGADNWEFSGTGLHSLDIRAIDIEKNNPSIIYVGTFGKGVLRSLDGGTSWNAAVSGINLGMSAPDVLDVNLNPNVAGELVASTLTTGILRSTNGGVTWQNVRAGGRLQDIVRAPNNSDILFAAHLTDGVLKSTDRGSTWAPTSFAQPNIFNIIFDPTDSSILYAGVNGDGVYKSTDGGDNWEKRSAGINNQLVRSLTIDAQNTNVLYAGCLQDNNPADPLPAQIHRTTNGGDTWEVISEGQFEAIVLLVDPVRTKVLYAATLGQGVFQSLDGGLTWSQINAGLGNTRVLALIFDPANSRNIFAGTFGNGVFRIGF